MNKRGISTLVTVVFVVSLGVLGTIIAFSFADIFFDKITESAEKKGVQDTVCIQEVVIDLQKGCYLDNDNVRLYIANNGIRDVDSFIVRLYSKDSRVIKDAEGVSRFMISNLDTEWQANANMIRMIEILPRISFNNKKVVCSSVKKSFGNLDSEETIPVCS